MSGHSEENAVEEEGEYSDDFGIWRTLEVVEVEVEVGGMRKVGDRISRVVVGKAGEI